MGARGELERSVGPLVLWSSLLDAHEGFEVAWARTSRSVPPWMGSIGDCRATRRSGRSRPACKPSARHTPLESRAELVNAIVEWMRSFPTGFDATQVPEY